MRKKAAIFIIIALMFTLFIPIAGATTDEVSVYVDGKQVKGDVPAKIINGSTMLPLRAILNALGVTDEQINWRQNSQSVQIKTNDTYIFLAVGVEMAIVSRGADVKNFTLPTTPVNISGRVLIPVRFVSEALNAQVFWDESARVVRIVTN